MKHLKMRLSLKITICILLSLSLTKSFSQTDKGNFLIGGTLGLGSSKTKDMQSEFETFSLNASPNVSLFIIDNLAVGLSIPYLYSRMESNNQKHTRNNISVGPSARYYFTFNKMAVFPTVVYSFGMSTREGPVFDALSGSVQKQVIEQRFNSLIFGGGFTYFLNKHVGIEGILSFERINYKYVTEEFSNVEISSLKFNIGFQIYL